MKKILAIQVPVHIFILLLATSGCGELVTVERTVNAVWSADESQILRVISTYETRRPKEKYYYAPSSRNWQYRFEICTPELDHCRVGGNAPDPEENIMNYVPVYWLPEIQKILYTNGSRHAVLKDLNGKETLLEPPAPVINEIFKNNRETREVRDLAPSPDESTIGIYFQNSYLSDPNNIFSDQIYQQCISFFDVLTGNHIFTQKIPFSNLDPYLNVIGQFHNRRCSFLWAPDGSGVYVVTRSISYFIRYADNAGIIETDYVPERGTITNSGTISNSGKMLQIDIDENKTHLIVVELTDWKPHADLGLIHRELNEYSFW
jgi:hypothetical protein